MCNGIGPSTHQVDPNDCDAREFLEVFSAPQMCPFRETYWRRSLRKPGRACNTEPTRMQRGKAHRKADRQTAAIWLAKV